MAVWPVCSRWACGWWNRFWWFGGFLDSSGSTTTTAASSSTWSRSFCMVGQGGQDDAWRKTKVDRWVLGATGAQTWWSTSGLWLCSATTTTTASRTWSWTLWCTNVCSTNAIWFNATAMATTSTTSKRSWWRSFWGAEKCADYTANSEGRVRASSCPSCRRLVKWVDAADLRCLRRRKSVVDRTSTTSSRCLCHMADSGSNGSHGCATWPSSGEQICQVGVSRAVNAVSCSATDGQTRSNLFARDDMRAAGVSHFEAVPTWWSQREKHHPQQLDPNNSSQICSWSWWDATPMATSTPASSWTWTTGSRSLAAGERTFWSDADSDCEGASSELSHQQLPHDPYGGCGAYTAHSGELFADVDRRSGSLASWNNDEGKSDFWQPQDQCGQCCWWQGWWQEGISW